MPPDSHSRFLRLRRYRRKIALYSRFLRAKKKASSSSTRLSGKVVAKTMKSVNDLPHEVLVKILQKVGTIEIMLQVRKVCVLWSKICRDPRIWRSIHMYNIAKFCNASYDVQKRTEVLIHKMTKVAIDWSCGQLINLNLEHLGNDHLLKYITDRKIQLKCLRIVQSYITDEGLSEAAKKMSSIEELHIDSGNIKHVGIENIGLNCPGLKSLTYKTPDRLLIKTEYLDSDNGTSLIRYFKDHCDIINRNSVAFAISRTMPQLQHLNLIGNGMTNEGLKAILDSCPLLESLDLRKCFKVNLGSNLELGKRCSSINVFFHPNDST